MPYATVELLAAIFACEDHLSPRLNVLGSRFLLGTEFLVSLTRLCDFL